MVNMKYNEESNRAIPVMYQQHIQHNTLGQFSKLYTIPHLHRDAGETTPFMRGSCHMSETLHY